MVKANPYAQIMDDSVMTATKEELTLMLYEGAIKFCNQAIAAVEKEDFAKSNQLILRVEDIVREFQITLDHQFPISKQFDALYDYMHRRLVEANMKKDIEMLGEVRDMFREFRDTWKQAMKMAKV